MQIEDNQVTYKNKVTLYKMFFDSIINWNEGNIAELINEKGSVTLFNVRGSNNVNYLNNPKDILTVQIVLDELIKSLKEGESLYMVISIMKHTAEEYEILDYKEGIESMFETDEAVVVRGGRVGYLIESINVFQRLINEVKGNLTARSQSSTTFIFQFYIVERSKVKYRECMPILSLVDLVFTEQNELIEQLGEYLYKVKESNRVQQRYTKEKMVNELMSRYLLSSTNALVCCHLDMHKFINYAAELISFLGLFKQTVIHAILFDGLENTIDVGRRVIPMRERRRLVSDEKRVTPSSGSLPIIPERHKSTVRSKKVKRTGRATTMKDYATINLLLRKEGKEALNSKDNYKAFHAIKLHHTKPLEQERMFIPKPNPTKEVTIDYAIKNIYGAFTVKKKKKNIKVPNYCIESEKTSDRDYTAQDLYLKAIDRNTSRKYSTTSKEIE
jgi:hypothetical protein